MCEKRILPKQAACGLPSCAAGHLFYMHLCENALMVLGWVGRDYSCMALGARQNKTTLDNLRLEVKLRYGDCGLRGAIKAQCSQEIRLACSPKLHFWGILLRLRLLEISSQLINLCMPQKYSFLTISQSSYPVKNKPHDKSSVFVLNDWNFNAPNHHFQAILCQYLTSEGSLGAGGCPIQASANR